jgi:hypothetical protein
MSLWPGKITYFLVVNERFGYHDPCNLCSWIFESVVAFQGAWVFVVFLSLRLRVCPDHTLHKCNYGKAMYFCTIYRYLRSPYTKRPTKRHPTHLEDNVLSLQQKCSCQRPSSIRPTEIKTTVWLETEFVHLLRSPGIDSHSGGPVRQPFLTYRPVRLHSWRNRSLKTWEV